MNSTDIVISICLCTYNRPNLLRKCLESLLKQEIEHPIEIIVTDNDCYRSGEFIIQEMKDVFLSSGRNIYYDVEPIQNIALARNRCLQKARGSYIAFIDDDETASTAWLQNLYKMMIEKKADGVWGPVIPVLPDSFPNWMRTTELFERENPEDGSSMTSGFRTGNALIRRKLLNLRSGPFDEALGRAGGEDSEFFNWIRIENPKVKFVWSKNGEVSELIEDKRRYLKWHLRRAYRGGWGYSRGLTEQYGAGKGLLFSIARIFPSFCKAVARSFINLKNFRYAMWIVLVNLATNAGKIGYFSGFKIEEYKG